MTASSYNLNPPAYQSSVRTEHPHNVSTRRHNCRNTNRRTQVGASPMTWLLKMNERARTKLRGRHISNLFCRGEVASSGKKWRSLRKSLTLSRSLTAEESEKMLSLTRWSRHMILNKWASKQCAIDTSYEQHDLEEYQFQQKCKEGRICNHETGHNGNKSAVQGV